MCANGPFLGFQLYRGSIVVIRRKYTFYKFEKIHRNINNAILEKRVAHFQEFLVELQFSIPFIQFLVVKINKKNICIYISASIYKSYNYPIAPISVIYIHTCICIWMQKLIICIKNVLLNLKIL